MTVLQAATPERPPPRTTAWAEGKMDAMLTEKVFESGFEKADCSAGFEEVRKFA
jgi:hypothetical protein